MTTTAAIDLDAYRAALHARDVLLGLLDGAPWLLRVAVRVENGAPVLLVLVTSRTEQVQCCVPSSVNDVPVQVGELASGRKSMNYAPTVRVRLSCDDMNGAMLGLLETLALAGAIDLRMSDLESGAVFDLMGRDREHAEHIFRNLRAWHIEAKVVEAKGGSR